MNIIDEPRWSEGIGIALIHQTTVLVGEDEIARVEHIIYLGVLLSQLTLDEILIATELSSVIAPDTAVIGAGRSVIEAIDCKVHHSVVWVSILSDRLVDVRHGACLSLDTFLWDEEVIMEVALVYQPEIGQRNKTEQGEERYFLEFALCIEEARD